MSLILTILLILCASLSADVEGRFVRVGDIRLQYVDWGGNGEALLFIPGGCDTAFVFGDVAERLAGRFRVLGLTARGCGASDRPASGYDMANQVEDILGFLDALGIRQITLIGHSSGGGKITQFAHSHPERVRRLIYLDTVYGYVAPGLDEKLGAAIGKAVTRVPMPEQRKARARLWELGAWSDAMDRNLAESRHAATPPEWRREVDRDMQAGLYFDTRIAHPALMIFAMDTDRDRARQFDQRTQRELQPLIDDTEKHRRAEIRKFRGNGPRVRVVEMRHTAHYCFVQRPAEVARRIAEFVADT
jgi:pimeloyl-ACP methyl ester carboxylesterase